jgi:hypothetical protein
MSFFLFKAVVSGLLIAAISEIARKSPAVAALVASLPLISVIGMIWIWRGSADPEQIARHAQATFWYVLPSLPMFLLIPLLLRSGTGFWISLLAGCGLTVCLYGLLMFFAARVGLNL